MQMLKLFCFATMLLWATGTAHAASPSAGWLNVTAAQEYEVKQAIVRLKAGNPTLSPLAEQPDLSGLETVLTSDAISVVEVAHVDFKERFFYLSVYNPWTHAQAWYGPFYLDIEPTQS